ncbi:MAG TPA: hydantoinase B/oxoprolinase family protein [Caulobacteraceae bacterium]|nr:hydantoinase B/oxoprolinase family protein [Caulobacteraceae bacterium]
MTTEISNKHGSGWAFWIDRGGTFTDVIGRAPDGGLGTLKLPSTSAQYEDAAVEAMRRLLGAAPGAPFPAERVAAIKMGTTVATNALLERKGAKTLLITTEGLGDALEIGDQARPELFALDIAKPAPLHAGVLEARERLDAAGRVLTPLDAAALAEGLARAKAEGYASVAVALLHADLNPAHETQAGDLARAAGFGHVTLSHEASPLPRLIARARTAVIDAYLTPILRAYVDKVARAVGQAPLYFMTSSGALVRAEAFRGKDAVLSGPAGGAVGCAQTARDAGAPAVLGFDVGGTSTDVCRFAGALERRAGLTIAGVDLRAPALDVQTVAAGGGSILSYDGFRARAGPHSAGAVPGPAAYGRGGPATVTDANLVLGRLDGRFFPPVFGPEGDRPLDTEAARARLDELARAMGAPSAEAAAEGFVAVTVEQTAQAIRRISTERGFDPRGHALVAFGGAAGQIACWTAEALGAGEVLCPPFASLLSAWGIGQAEVRSLKLAGLEAPLHAEGLGRAEALADRLRSEAEAALKAQGAEPGASERRLMLRYDGADAALPAPFGSPAAIRAAFEAAHQRLFGFVQPDHPVLIASVEVECAAPSPAPGADRLPRSAGGTPNSPPSPPFAPQGGRIYADGQFHPCPIVDADAFNAIDGPALIVRGDTQIALKPGWRATREWDGLIRLHHVQPHKIETGDVDRPDPVTLELFNRRFMGVAEAMGAALERTAQSVNIKERLDFSCALFDAEGGLVANAPHMPVHLGSMDASVKAVKARHPELKPGDAFALNNPYAGGTHLPDITVVMPVFMAGEKRPAFYMAARGHHADIGGVQPGSMPPFSTNIAEEGVLLDALPIMRAGQLLEADIRRALASGPWPARAPERNLADLKAQLAACNAGAGAVSAMIDSHGAAMVARYMGFVQDNAEACVRRAVGKLKDGHARVPMDGGAEIYVRIAVDAEAGEAVLDFTGTSGVRPNNFNAPTAIVYAAALYVFRTLVDDDIPLNAGCLKPLKIIAPLGSMLAPEPPAAVVAGNVETSQHIVDALYLALGVMANAQGTMNNFTFGDEARQYYETLCGGAGATARAPGASAVHTHMTNTRLTDPEILERRFPVRLERFAVRRGSGGTGARAGGDGLVRRVRFLAPLQTALLSTRRETAPQGLDGGGSAQPGRQSLISASGEAKDLPGCFSIMAAEGEAIEILTPGGGGHGSEAMP